MLYRETNKSDAARIRNLEKNELGWSSSTDHLVKTLEKYPGVVATEDGEICGFAYSNPLASDVLRVSNILVAKDCRNSGVGSHLLDRLESLAEDSYHALVLLEDQQWFDGESRPWIEKNGYRNIYATDQSGLFLKELPS